MGLICSKRFVIIIFMNQKILEYSKKHLKKNPAQIRPGDWVKVHHCYQDGKKTRVQIFEGVVIAIKHGQGIDAQFTVYKIASGGIAVQYSFPLHSPSIIKIERVKTSKVARAKLNYLKTIKSSKITLNKEKKALKIWEEPTLEEELEKIKKQKEAAAQAKEEKKKQAAEELERKFQQAKAARQN